jgi:CRP-like cAMP-binding protein
MPRKFKKGTMIYKEDDDVEELYLIRTGLLSIGFTLKAEKFSGKEVGQRSCIGAYYVINQKKAEFFYEAATDVEAIGINGTFFMDVIEKHKKKGEEIKNETLDDYVDNIRIPLVYFIIIIRKQVLVQRKRENCEEI